MLAFTIFKSFHVAYFYLHIYIYNIVHYFHWKNVFHCHCHCKQNKIKKKHLLDKLLTITGAYYLERKPAICQNFNEKKWLLPIFLVYFKEISIKYIYQICIKFEN